MLMTDQQKWNKWKVSIDTPNCISCWACTSICPKIFKFNKELKSIVNNQPENKEELECAKQAEKACPVKIIVVKDNS